MKAKMLANERDLYTFRKVLQSTIAIFHLNSSDSDHGE